MAEEKAQITVRLPVALAREIDALAGPRKRSAFVAAAVEQELRRRTLAARKSAEIQAQEALERKSLN